MIYLDSCIVVYLVEKHPAFYAQLDRSLRQHAPIGFAISPLVVLECLVGPLKQGDAALGERYERFFTAVTSLPNDEAVFREAAWLRAHFGIKTPDALHLAVANRNGCMQFWTNDDAWSKSRRLR